MQLTEDKNDNDGMSTDKYNEHWRQARVCKEEVEQRACEKAERCQAEEQQRVEAEKHRAEEQAKRWVGYSWLIMMELTVLGRGGRCPTAWKGQGEGVRAARV